MSVDSVDSVDDVDLAGIVPGSLSGIPHPDVLCPTRALLLGSGAVFYITQGDTLPPIEAQLCDADGESVNLTGATVVFHLRSLKAPSAQVAADARIDYARRGYVSYPWAGGDTDQAGDFLAEFRVTFGDGATLTFPNGASIPVVIGRSLG